MYVSISLRTFSISLSHNSYGYGLNLISAFENGCFNCPSSIQAFKRAGNFLGPYPGTKLVIGSRGLSSLTKNGQAEKEKSDPQKGEILNNDKCRVIIEYEDGTVAIWGEIDEEQVETYMVTTFGQPDTIHT